MSCRHSLFVGWTLLFGLAAPAGMAQHITGTILGTVKDASGAVIPRATVAVTNEGTNIKFTASTETTGDYVASNLSPGIYTVTAELRGFKTEAVRNVKLLANRTVRVDFALQPGPVTERIEVQAALPVVNSENGTVGSILESQTITALPLNGRSVNGLIAISAGVNGGWEANPRVAGSAYWGGTQFNVDGLNYNDSGNGGGAYGYGSGLFTMPSIDTISEFKLDSNNQKAEFESTASVTMVTKSGTNEFHGSAYEFNRNKAYAAKSFFSEGAPKAPYNRNEFGFTLGGPVRRNKTFFFGSYESLRERFSRTNRLSVATEAMRNGDFSGLPVIIDPLKGEPFHNNRIPNDRIDSRSKTLIGYVPLPNLPGIGPAGTLLNYIVTVPNIRDINRYSARLDHSFSEKDTLWGSANYSKGDPYFVGNDYPLTYGHWSNGGYLTYSLNLTYVHMFSPRTLNEARFGWFRHGSLNIGMNKDFDARSLFPDLFPQPGGGLPNMNIADHVAIGDYGGSDRETQFIRQYIDNFTHVRGRHTLKAGFDFGNFRNGAPPIAFGMGQGALQDAGYGSFTFNGRYTNDDPSSSAQPAHAFADYLLGYPVSTARAAPSPIFLLYSTRYSAYAQDDWQVSPRLTLSFGLRYMVQTAWKERDGAMANFDFRSGKLIIPGEKLPPQALARLVAAYPIVTAAQAGLSHEGLATHKKNFAPRLGFAFRPFADIKTVIRGGVGLYYNFLPAFIGPVDLVLNPPFLLAETFESDPGPLPSLTLARPFVGTGTIDSNPSIYAQERNMRNGVSQQWNLTVERELASDLGLRVSYVGNKASHLPWFLRAANLPEQQAAGALQPRRPYQPWSDISLIAAGADSVLHQMQVEVTRRFSQGLSLQAEYSWNRSLDNAPIVGGPQNPYNNRADRGNSDGIRRHILALAYSYELPFGPGKRFARFSGPLRRVVEGWQVGGITLLRTGPPFSVFFSPTQPGWFRSRADAVLGRKPSLSRSERSMDRWFDTGAFAVPTPYTYGNSARNLLFAPGDVSIDFSVLKNTRVRERWTVQFRGEFFNLPNHPNLSRPRNNISSPNVFGRIFGAVNNARQIQFGLKVLF